MDNILYQFIADRNTPILDNIQKYCIIENKDELSIIKTTFHFLEGIKKRLDNSFIRLCMEHILRNADENTKKTFSLFDITQIRVTKGCETIVQNAKERLKKIEGGKGAITELMYYLINSNKTEYEKCQDLCIMISKAKDVLYMIMLTGLYTSEESGISIGYKNHLGDKITHIYTRANFIQDIELINAQYDNLLNEEKENFPNREKQEYKNTSKDKEEMIRNILKLSITRKEDKICSIFEYLDSAKEVIHTARNKKETTGAICLALTENNIFKENLKFNEIMSIMSEYWEVNKPAYGKPGKYECTMIDLKNKYLFIEKGII